jgi:hypothetical protein
MTPETPYVSTTAETLQDLIVAAVKGKTVAGDNIFTPRDWPARADLYPMLKVSSPTERKQSLGPNGPQFMTSVTIRLTGTLTAKPQKNNAGAGAALAALAIWQRQIEVTVINDYQLFRVIQEMESVDVVSNVSQQGETHIGELTMDFVMKFPQGPEDFAPPEFGSLRELHVFADLVNVASPTGTFAPPINYPVTPSPRVLGPDGRVEGEALIDLEGG